MAQPKPLPLPQPGVVHPGNLQRWYEQLCRIRHSPLRSVVPTGFTVSSEVPDEAAIYAFWWVGPLDRLASAHLDLVLKGPGGRPIPLRFDAEWLGLEAGTPIPLYVGKTAAGLRTRVKQHLLLGRARAVDCSAGDSLKVERPTTSCQLRAGVDQLFPVEADTRDLVLDNVGLSYVLLPGDVNAANRFYLEDLAVGMMRPALNVDVER